MANNYLGFGSFSIAAATQWLQEQNCQSIKQPWQSTSNSAKWPWQQCKEQKTTAMQQPWQYSDGDRTATARTNYCNSTMTVAMEQQYRDPCDQTIAATTWPKGIETAMATEWQQGQQNNCGNKIAAKATKWLQQQNDSKGNQTTAATKWPQQLNNSHN